MQSFIGLLLFSEAFKAQRKKEKKKTVSKPSISQKLKHLNSCMSLLFCDVPFSIKKKKRKRRKQRFSYLNVCLSADQRQVPIWGNPSAQWESKDVLQKEPTVMCFTFSVLTISLTLYGRSRCQLTERLHGTATFGKDKFLFFQSEF